MSPRKGMCSHRCAVGHRGRVIIAHGAGKHPATATGKMFWHDSSIFECCPGQFKHQSLLRIHRPSFGGVNSEERGVKPFDVIKKGAMPKR